MGKVITVKWICKQSAEDVYRSVEKPHRVYIRQPSNCDDLVFWFSTTKWRGGYEASCPIKAGITMRAVTDNGNYLFEETLNEDTWNGGTSAKKVGDFSYEAIKMLEKGFREALNLSEHEKWREWLVSFKEQYEYEGYDENWMYFETENIEREKFDAIYTYLGKECVLVRDKERHKICGCEWDVFTLVDKTDTECIALCGYRFSQTENTDKEKSL